jgi:hypothetical protein
MLTQSELSSRNSQKTNRRCVLKIGVFGLSLIAGALLVSCKTASAPREMASEAVQCDKCKVTWVKVPHRAGKAGIVSYSAFKQMECPDCRNAVLNFFETGKFQHECKTCGGNLAICEAH